MVNLRPATASDCAALTDLSLRSKAHWGYDEAFMDACVPALTVDEATLDEMEICVVDGEDGPSAMVGLGWSDGWLHLQRLFVAPEAMGQGLGERCLDWAAERARDMGANRLWIESDPGAEAFYLRKGAIHMGEVPSEVIPGRQLPFLALSV